MATDMRELIRARRDEILRVAADHGARNVRLFGSAARGEAREDSDIDLLVDLQPGHGLLSLAALGVSLERMLGRKVDVLTERGLRERIRPRVLADAVAL